MSTIAALVPLVIALAGCLTTIEDPANTTKHRTASQLQTCFVALDNLCNIIGVSLAYIIIRKMEINSIKYNRQACLHYRSNRGAFPKYVDLANVTGIYRDGQIKMFPTETRPLTAAYRAHSLQHSFPTLATIVANFAIERGWQDKYTFSMIMIALYSELGELAKTVEWKRGEENIAKNPALIDSTTREIADIAIYLIHLARIAEIPDPFAAKSLTLQIDENLLNEAKTPF